MPSITPLNTLSRTRQWSAYAIYFLASKESGNQTWLPTSKLLRRAVTDMVNAGYATIVKTTADQRRMFVRLTVNPETGRVLAIDEQWLEKADKPNQSRQ